MTERQRYFLSFKLKAIKMIETNGFNLNETARDLQIDVKTLSSWLKSKKHWCQLTTPLDDSLEKIKIQ
jgi:transposase-like protein